LRKFRPRGHRDHDLEALQRFYKHLEPGGTLVLDNEVPYSQGSVWRYWPKDARSALPVAWRASGNRRRGSDGAEYELRSRLVDLDPLTQRVTYEIRATMRRDNTLVAEEDYSLQMTLYFTNEIELMLKHAGFVNIEVRAGYSDAAPTADDDFVVCIARKPAPSAICQCLSELQQAQTLTTRAPHSRGRGRRGTRRTAPPRRLR
jgi:hypothetical protein